MWKYTLLACVLMKCINCLVKLLYLSYKLNNFINNITIKRHRKPEATNYRKPIRYIKKCISSYTSLISSILKTLLFLRIIIL